MSSEPSQAPAPGHSGDYVGARRGRRAFRFAVTACVALSASLWFSENYLRYDKSESQYRMALTLPNDSARAILRNVVKRERESSDVPRARYVEALASIEESDIVLSRYDEAYKLDPNNASLILNYGCQMCLEGKYKEARERFREAGILPPKSVLPRYLEAAAVALSTPSEEDMSEAIALLARTNTAADPMLFPEPLWHPSLPERGFWHAKLRHEIVERCCAPLYRFEKLLTGRARTQIEEGHIRDWESWLEKLQTLGERLVGTPQSRPEDLGVAQAKAGLQFQLDAVELRRRIQERIKGTADQALIERNVKLASAMGRLSEFEGERQTKIQKERYVHLLPLKLIAVAFVILLVNYALAMFLSKAVDRKRVTWALPHSRVALYVLTGGGIVLLGLLVACRVFYDKLGAGSGAFPVLENTWYVVTASLLLFEFAYPIFFAATQRQHQSGEEATPETGEVPWQPLSAKARVTLARRYAGVLLGVFLCMVSVWFIGFRTFSGLYPVQLELLVSGLEAEELQAIHQVQNLLR